MNRSKVAQTLWALIVLVSFAQAEDRASLTARLKDANASSAIDGDGVIPWHLKLNVQLPAGNGKPSEQGSIEEWWMSSQSYQIAYTLPSYNAVEVHHLGDHRRTKGAASPPELLKMLVDQVVHPMPRAENIEESEPELRTISFGKIPLECIMLGQKMKKAAVLPLGLFPTYCFDPGKNYLRLSYDLSSLAIFRNTFVAFQSRVIATNITIKENDITRVIGQVTLLQSKDMPLPPEINPDAVTTMDSSLVQVPSNTMAGFISSRTAPIYPSTALASHTEGTVVIRAVIGTDGRVQSMRLISATDPGFAIAALTAVRQWRYKPYIVNGVPTDVDTEVKVNFNMR